VATSLTNDFISGTIKYSVLKDAVSDTLVDLTKGFIQKKNDLMQDKSFIENKIQEMSAKARELAAKTMREVRDLAGLPQIL